MKTYLAFAYSDDFFSDDTLAVFVVEAHSCEDALVNIYEDCDCDDPAPRIVFIAEADQVSTVLGFLNVQAIQAMTGLPHKTSV